MVRASWLNFNLQKVFGRLPSREEAHLNNNNNNNNNNRPWAPWAYFNRPSVVAGAVFHRWAYGITLVEVFAEGAMPYSSCIHSKGTHCTRCNFDTTEPYNPTTDMPSHVAPIMLYGC